MPKTLTPRMISDFCKVRLSEVLDTKEREALTKYLVELLDLGAFPPYRGKWIDLAQVALAMAPKQDLLREARGQNAARQRRHLSYALSLST